MSTETTYYDLVKPGGSDRVSIGVIDSNLDAIDTQFHSLDVQLASLDAYTSHLPPSSDKVFYVSRGASSDDSNTGLSWGDAFATFEEAAFRLSSSAGVICLGPGTHTVANTVALYTGTRVVGFHPLTTTLSKTTSGVMFSSVSDVSFHGIRFSVTTSPVFYGAYANCRWTSCRFNQTATDQPIFDVTNFTFCGFDETCYFTHTTSATVPMFRGITPNNDINANFFRGTWTASGNYAIWLESTGGGFTSGNTIDCDFEVCGAGCVKLLSASGTKIRAGVYDLSGATTRDLFSVGTSTAGGAAASRFIEFNNVYRYGGSLGSNLVDIRIGAGTNSTLIIGVDKSSSGLSIDMGSRTGFIINPGSSTITNSGACGTVNGYGMHCPPAGTTNAFGAATAYRAGTSWFNTSVGKPVWSNGTHWVDAAGTTVE